MANSTNIPALSRTEWLAVSIGLQDAVKHGCDGRSSPTWFEGRLQRLASLLCGIERPRPLADPRLETLRQFVCSVRSGHAIDNEHAPRLLEQGFNPAQLNAIALLADQAALGAQSPCAGRD